MPDAWFSPNAGAAAAIAEYINTAIANVDMMAFQYQLGPIHNAMIAMAQAGVQVRLILDRRQQFLEDVRVKQLRDAGAQVLFDKYERQQCLTFATIDYEITFTGSYVYTAQAELRNTSDLVKLVTSPWDLLYPELFQYHWAHSVYQ